VVEEGTSGVVQSFLRLLLGLANRVVLIVSQLPKTMLSVLSTSGPKSVPF